MRYLITFVAFLTFQNLVCAQQEEFRPGYVVRSDGDTLTGLVRDRKFGFNDELTDKLTVKLENGKTRRIKKKYISAYKRGDELFERILLVEKIIGIRTETESFLIHEAKGDLHLYRLVYTDYDNHRLDYIFFIRDHQQENFRRIPVIGWKGIIRKAFGHHPDFIEMLDNGEFRYPDIPEIVQYGNQISSD